MPAAPVQILFGAPDCKLTNKMLGHIASMVTPDLPANNTSMIGDFAFSEICISDVEASTLRDTIIALRNGPNPGYIHEVLDRLAGEKSKAVAKVAESIEAEYARICKVFFLRSRCMEVSRVSTNEVIGRIISFPDQISDDYGNNLEPRGEKGMNPGKVAHAYNSGERKGATLYIGHGQGATMAQICACLNDEQCIILDGTITSELLTQNFFQNELPKTVKMEERQGGDREWNILFESLEVVESRLAAGIPAVMEVAKEVAQKQAAERAEEAKKKREEERKEGKPQPPKKEGPSDAEVAATYFEKRITNKLSGLVNSAALTRFQGSGKFPASAISNFVTEYTTIVSTSNYPFQLPAEEEEGEQA